MVYTTAMEMRNGLDYCYGDYELFSPLIWTQGMVFTTAMDTWNGFHYCYGEKVWFSLLLWRQGMVFTTAMETMNRFHYCYRDEEWNYNGKYKSYILCFRLILDTYGIIIKIKIIYIVFFGLF